MNLWVIHKTELVGELFRDHTFMKSTREGDGGGGGGCALRLVETIWLVENFFKTIDGAFRNNRSINLLIHRR